MDKTGRGDLRLTQELEVGRMNLGDDHGEAWGWAFYRLSRVAAPHSYALESMRFPGYFVEACDVGTMVDRTHGSVRLTKAQPTAATNGGQSSSGSSRSANSTSKNCNYDVPTECWFTLAAVAAADGLSHVYSVRSTKYSKLPSYLAADWATLSDMANSKAVARAAAAGAGENRGATKRSESFNDESGAGTKPRKSPSFSFRRGPPPPSSPSVAGEDNGYGTTGTPQTTQQPPPAPAPTSRHHQTQPAVGWYLDANPAAKKGGRGRPKHGAKAAFIHITKIDEPNADATFTLAQGLRRD